MLVRLESRNMLEILINLLISRQRKVIEVFPSKLLSSTDCLITSFKRTAFIFSNWQGGVVMLILNLKHLN